MSVRPAVATTPVGGAARLGATMWLAQPAYILTEFITAAGVTVPFSFADNTISDLGASTCGVVQYPFGPVQVCSPWHALMNGSFVVFGLLQAFGAVLLRGWLPAGALRTISMLLWVISGLGSIVTGLVPLDQNLELHVLVSSPAFVAQPAALLTLGLALRHRRRGLAWSALVTGVVSAAGAASMFALSDRADFGGLFERLALWPGYLWAAAMAVVVLSTARAESAGSR